VDRGTTVAITGVEAATTRSTRLRPRDGIVITGTAEAVRPVTVKVWPATVAANGTYTATLPAPTADGPLAVTVTARTRRGNTATDTRSSRWTAAPRDDHGCRGRRSHRG
jgi:hypothetical protein